MIGKPFEESASDHSSSKTKPALAVGVLSPTRSSHRPLSSHDEIGIKQPTVIDQLPSAAMGSLPVTTNRRLAPKVYSVEPSTSAAQHVLSSVPEKSDDFESQTLSSLKANQLFEEADEMSTVAGVDNLDKNIKVKGKGKKSRKSQKKQKQSLCERLGVNPTPKYNIPSVTNIMKNIEERKLAQQLPHRLGPLVCSPSRESVTSGCRSLNPKERVSVASLCAPLTGLRRGKNSSSLRKNLPCKPQPQHQNLLPKLGNLKERSTARIPKCSSHQSSLPGSDSNNMFRIDDQFDMRARQPFIPVDETSLSATCVEPAEYWQDELPYQVQNELPYQLQNELPYQVQNELRYQVQNELPYQVQNELPYQVQNELPYQVQNELPYQVQNELPYQVQNELPYQVQNELPYQMQNELPYQMQNELPYQMQNEMYYQEYPDPAHFDRPIHSQVPVTHSGMKTNLASIQ
ncbi:hypothetical protein BSL78_13120 [Apostichopus japonicus]|uniref:Uncharacterized protein n=1 Tax=Stichopus japonicus TaxID=307972 RepID=A0A2G8KPW2_STIJA|nr:hypothetical protein BSL78_13120 [Apostichopus japonicus]